MTDAFTRQRFGLLADSIANGDAFDQPCAAGYTSISAGSFAAANASLRIVFASGSRLSSLSAIANRNCAFIFGTSRCGLSGFLVTRPPPWNEAPAPTRSGTAAAVRIVIGPLMQ